MTRSIEDILFQPAASQAKAIRDGQIGAVELATAAISRIERENPRLNAVVVFDFERALKDAAAADASLARGEHPALLGVPMTVKESFDLAGHPNTWGLFENKHHVAREDSAVVRRLKQAGAIILGKTNVPPLLADWQSENPIYGRTVNPWDSARTPGGSSGGSSAAVAAGLTAVDVGSDIGGSVRVPAAFCGVFGLKTSYGIISMQGTAAGGQTAVPAPLSVAGPLARDAHDLELVLKAIVGPDDEQPATHLALPPARARNLGEFRILVVDRHPVAQADQDVLAALHETIETCARAGASVTGTSDLLPDLAAAHRLYLKILLTVTTRRGKSDRQPLSAHAFLDCLDAQLLLRRQWARLFEAFDIVLAPTIGVAAFPHAPEPAWKDRRLMIDGVATPFGDQLGWISMATVANLPAVSFPAGLDRQGLPIGIQAIGPWLGDLTCTAFSGLVGRFQPPPPLP